MSFINYVKRIFFACSNFLVIASLFGGEENRNSAPLFVSLGSSCDVAIYLKEGGLRKMGFPLDWVLSIDGERFLELIANDFEGFIDDANMTHHGHVLVNSYYHVEFRHDYAGHLKDKYTRRIQRFRDLKNYSGKVFFIRIPYREATNPTLYYPNEDGFRITKEWGYKLNEILKKRFPHLDFMLVLVNEEEGNREEFMSVEENIIRFNYGDFRPKGKYHERMLETLVDFAKSPRSVQSSN